ncbi:MAG: ShlB/FhaC/HecB family hemolysin secretion/activation protein [Rubrivivax sp.]|nr:ShlB/FhaC/HecB family hemolysin secretion/activation protein [Rubrivivax sp.]
MRALMLPRLLPTLAAATAAGALVAAAAPPARAQAPGTQPGQIERQFQQPPQPRALPGQFQIPMPSLTPPAGSEGIRFRLRGISLDGMTLYPADSWPADYQGLFGREVSLADIYAFANALTTRYRNDGYILSQVIVPAQTVEQGYVRLQAVEGYLAEVRFEGSAPSALMKAQAEALRAQRPLRAETLERALLLMNDQPGTFARAVLMASATPGASDLVVQSSAQAVTAGLSLDNRGGRALGPLRATLDVEQRGLLGWGDRTGLRAVAAEKGELKYFAFNHEQAVGHDGTRAGLSLGRVRSRPDTGTSFIPLDLETSSDSAALTLSHPFLRGRHENRSARVSLTAHNGHTNLFGVRDTEDRIRALRVGLGWDLADAARGINLVDIELARGFEGAGSSRAGDPLLSRANGKPAFTKLGLYAARLQGLTPQWSLLAALSAQVALDDLLAPELFSFGGEQFGRGYDPSELVGDHGAALKVEVRWSFAGGGSGSNWLGGATLYGFYDAGQVRQRSPGGLAAQQSASSAGLGVRFELQRWLSGYLEAAKPLSRVVAAEGNRDPRGYAGLSLRY